MWTRPPGSGFYSLVAPLPAGPGLPALPLRCAERCCRGSSFPPAALSGAATPALCWGLYQTQLLGKNRNPPALVPYSPSLQRVRAGDALPLVCTVSVAGSPQISTSSMRSLCPESQGTRDPQNSSCSRSQNLWLCAAGSQPHSKVGGNIIFLHHIPRRLFRSTVPFLLCGTGMEIVPDTWQKPDSACLVLSQTLSFYSPQQKPTSGLGSGAQPIQSRLCLGSPASAPSQSLEKLHGGRAAEGQN